LSPKKITRRQREALLAAIEIEREQEDGFRYAELAQRLGVKVGSVQPLVEALLKAEYLKQVDPGVAGGIRVAMWPNGEPFDAEAAHRRWVIDRVPVEQLLRNVAERASDPPPTVNLTTAQQRVLEAAQRAYSRAGRPVTLAQIAAERKQPPHIVERHVPALRDGGFIRSGAGGYEVALDVRGREVRPPVPRDVSQRADDRPPNPAVQLLEAAIEILQHPDIVHVPVLGRAAGGRPIEGVTDIGEITIPVDWLGRRSPAEFYALRVVGDSMSAPPARIGDGDTVIVRSEPFDISRDRFAIWVIWDDRLGGAAVKWLHPDATSGEDALLLASSNNAYKPISTTAGTIVQGRVVKVIRDLE
jgi:SOS-response transcriptional repressor LexA